MQLTRSDLEDEEEGGEIVGMDVKDETKIVGKPTIKEEKISTLNNHSTVTINQQFLDIEIRHPSCFNEEIESDEDLDQL